MSPKPKTSALDQKHIRESDTRLDKLLLHNEELKLKYNSARATRAELMVWLLLVAVIATVLIFSNAIQTGSKFNVLSSLFGRQVTPLEVLVVVLIFEVGGMLGVWYVLDDTRKFNRELKENETEIDEISLKSPSSRLSYFQKQFSRYSSKSMSLNWIDNKRRKSACDLRRTIGDNLSRLEDMQTSGRSKKVKLEVVTPEWDDVHFSLAQWGELLQDEDRELTGEKRWKIWLIGIAALYLLILILAIPGFSTDRRILGVPFPIIVWGGVGSFAAILHRFYKSPRRINLEIELRWLFARPIIGIVMGSVSYLALVSGALVFSATPSQDLAAELDVSAEQWQFWVVAFLGGFSDKFYEKIIEWLTGTFTAGSSNTAEDENPENDEEDNEVVAPNENETEKEAEGTKG
jgi:hypothetical protein